MYGKRFHALVRDRRDMAEALLDLLLFLSWDSWSVFGSPSEILKILAKMATFFTRSLGTLHEANSLWSWCEVSILCETNFSWSRCHVSILRENEFSTELVPRQHHQRKEFSRKPVQRQHSPWKEMPRQHAPQKEIPRQGSLGINPP